MANQYAYGVDGAVYLGEVASNINSWSMTITPGVADVTDIGSSGPKRAYTKFNDFSGSVNGQYQFDPSSAASPAQEQIIEMFVSGGTPVAVQARFVESSASMYWGTVVFTNISRNQPSEGFQTWSADWAQSNGPLNYATSTST